MSKMAELDYDIEQLWIEGLNAGQIAGQLNCDKSQVLAWIAERGIKPFGQWNKAAQQRLIQDLNLSQ